MEEQHPSEEAAAPLAAPSHPFRWRWLVALTLLAALTYAAFSLPLPFFYAFLPGPVKDVERLVEVSEAQTYSSEGSLYLTTVSVDVQVTFAEWVQSMFDDERLIVGREQVTGGGTFKELEEQQKLEMNRSQQQAREVALTALDLKVGKGVRVVQTAEDSPAEGVLRTDDVIVAVDDHKVSTDCDAIELISSYEPGDSIELTLQRGGATKRLTLTTTSSPDDSDRAFVGIYMETVEGLGPRVNFKTGRIAGPSAGLMFSLGLYDRLTPEDLTHGRKIAGTGTIACGGVVGPIGGIQQKVVAAEQEGAVIFLAPADNAAEARAVADEIEIVSIETFDDALRYLEDL